MSFPRLLGSFFLQSGSISYSMSKHSSSPSPPFDQHMTLVLILIPVQPHHALTALVAVAGPWFHHLPFLFASSESNRHRAFAIYHTSWSCHISWLSSRACRFSISSMHSSICSRFVILKAVPPLLSSMLRQLLQEAKDRRPSFRFFLALEIRKDGHQIRVEHLCARPHKVIQFILFGHRSAILLSRLESHRHLGSQGLDFA